MTYRDFTIDDVAGRLGLTLDMAPLFVGLTPVAPPAWLPGAIGSVTPDLLGSEKSRSEFLVAPLLRAAQQVGGRVALHSGYTLNIDAAKGLNGECDFILALSLPLPALVAPAASAVEAKRGSLGQCIAQMRGLQIFNDRAGHDRPIWGGVTTGDQWQFLRLDADSVTLDPPVRYLPDLDLIFACLLEMLKPVTPAIATPAP